MWTIFIQKILLSCTVVVRFKICKLRICSAHLCNHMYIWAADWISEQVHSYSLQICGILLLGRAQKLNYNFVYNGPLRENTSPCTIGSHLKSIEEENNWVKYQLCKPSLIGQNLIWTWPKVRLIKKCTKCDPDCSLLLLSKDDCQLVGSVLSTSRRLIFHPKNLLTVQAVVNWVGIWYKYVDGLVSI